MKLFIEARYYNGGKTYFTLNAVLLEDACHRVHKANADIKGVTASTENKSALNLSNYHLTINNNFKTSGNMMVVKDNMEAL